MVGNVSARLPRGSDLAPPALGRRLLIHVREVMRSGADVPAVKDTASLRDAMQEMTRGRIGMTAVIDAGGHLIGVFTDGDLRRTLDRVADIHSARLTDVMTRNPRTISPDKLAVEAVKIMEEFKVNQLLVVEAGGKLVGALNMHDLFRAKVL